MGLPTELKKSRNRSQKTSGAKRNITRGLDAETARTNVTKLSRLADLLRDPQGASLAEMMTITGWQAHSVRGALAGALKKKLGAKIVSSKEVGAERRYRVEAVDDVG